MSRVIQSQNVPLEQIQNFNNEYADDIFNDDITPLRDYTDPVEERRCNKIMIITICLMTSLCIFVAEGSSHYLEGGKRAWNAERDRHRYPEDRSDSMYHSNLRPYGSDWDIGDEIISSDYGSKVDESKGSKATEANSEISRDGGDEDKAQYDASDSIYNINLKPYEQNGENETISSEDNHEDADEDEVEESEAEYDASDSIYNINLKPYEQNGDNETISSEDNHEDADEDEVEESEGQDQGGIEQENSSVSDTQSKEYIIEEDGQPDEGEHEEPKEEDKYEDESENSLDEESNKDGEEAGDETKSLDTGSDNEDQFGPTDVSEENEDTAIDESSRESEQPEDNIKDQDIADDDVEVEGEGEGEGEDQVTPEGEDKSVEEAVNDQGVADDQGTPTEEGEENINEEGADSQKLADGDIEGVGEDQGTPNEEGDDNSVEEATYYQDAAGGDVEDEGEPINEEGEHNSMEEDAGNEKAADSFFDLRNEEKDHKIDGDKSNRTEYPEFVVQEKEDPLYPGKNSPLNPYRPKDTTTEVKNPNTKYNNTSTGDDDQYQPSTYDNQEKGQSYSSEVKNPNTKYNNTSTGDDDQYQPSTHDDHEKGQSYSSEVKNPNTKYNNTSMGDDDQYQPSKHDLAGQSYHSDVKNTTQNDGYDSVPTSVTLDPSLKYKFGGIEQAFVPGVDIPFFWYIPRTAGTAIETMLTRCHSMVAAGNKGAIGGANKKKFLEVITPFPGENFVNVELRTEEGIQRAIDLNVIGSGLVDVVFASRLNQVKSIFHPPSNQARCFTLMRHPVDRAVSLFYYLKNAAHEQSYNKEMSDMNIDEYIESKKAESDWMTRSLAQDKLQGGVLDEDDLFRAMKFLRTKCVIGLTSKFSVSYRRFEAYFELGSPDQAGCENKIMGDLALTTKGHPKVKPGSKTWRALEDLNHYDMKLYNYAVQLFEEQGQLFA